ncbi:MAG: hypothetical protein HDKAJFGB_04078 [Anaerolineae bacterium]|nr:hypothetical protein [Anaerolineae bacterium]
MIGKVAGVRDRTKQRFIGRVVGAFLAEHDPARPGGGQSAEGGEFFVHLGLQSFFVLDLRERNTHMRFEVFHMTDRIPQGFCEFRDQVLIPKPLDVLLRSGAFEKVVIEWPCKGITHYQAMIHEGEWQSLSMRFNPHGQFGQFHSERVFVNAVEAVHRDHATAQRQRLALRQPGLLPLRGAAGEIADQLIVGIGEREDSFAILLRFGLERFAIRFLLRLLGLTFGGQGAFIAETAGFVQVLAEESAGFDQKMPAPHRGIEDS